jgi:hypothetical protein
MNFVAHCDNSRVAANRPSRVSPRIDELAKALCAQLPSEDRLQNQLRPAHLSQRGDNTLTMIERLSL